VGAQIPASARQCFLAVFDELGNVEKIAHGDAEYTKFCGGSSTVFTVK